MAVRQAAADRVSHRQVDQDHPDQQAPDEERLPEIRGQQPRGGELDAQAAETPDEDQRQEEGALGPHRRLSIPGAW